jgi:pSer/pThr/pTyr-binding forkhead associated (FHA) protein
MAESQVLLKALTPEAAQCLGVSVFTIPVFPFRVGRESRVGETPGFLNSRRRPDSIPNNDLYLVEKDRLMNVSREHFQIERRDDGFFLVDRCSVCGTLVEGVVVGKDRTGGEARLENGDVIIVGTSISPYAFKFLVR